MIGVGRQQQLTGTQPDTQNARGVGIKYGIITSVLGRGVICRTIRLDKIKMSKKNCYICKKEIPEYYGNFCIKCWLELKKKAKVAEQKKSGS